MLKTARVIFLPEGLILLAAVAILQIGEVRAPLERFLDIAPYVVLLAGAFLSWRFRRPRVFLALTVLALSDLALGHDPGFAMRGALGTMLPLTLVLLAVGEGGITTGSGRLAMTVVGVQIAMMITVLRPVGTLPQSFDFPLLPTSLATSIDLPSLAVTAFALSALGLIVLVVRRKEPLLRGFLWALFAVSLGFAAASDQTTYFAVGGLMLVVALVEDAHTLAYRDGLTGLPARRAFDDALKRLRSRYAIAIVDVDRFKKFNDTYGHDVGDQVLRMVAHNLEQVSGGGRAYRYGGEEFAIVFPGKSIDQAEPHLETLRARIADASFALRAPDRPKKEPDPREPRMTEPQMLSVTVSIGVAQVREDSEGPQAVVKAADQALYRAKRNGRNKVMTERRKKWRPSRS